MLAVHARYDIYDAAVSAGFGLAESVCKLLADPTPEPELETRGKHQRPCALFLGLQGLNWDSAHPPSLPNPMIWAVEMSNLSFGVTFHTS